jgi:hypothetical protein
MLMLSTTQPENKANEKNHRKITIYSYFDRIRHQVQDCAPGQHVVVDKRDHAVFVLQAAQQRTLTNDVRYASLATVCKHHSKHAHE